jgi:xylulokinase
MLAPHMNRDRYVLAIDLGTGGPKTALVSMRGEIAGHELIPVETRRLPDGGALQDPADWWQAITSSARRLLASGIVRPQDVVAVACTGQWASTIPVDEHGDPAGDCILWMDGRGEPYSSKVVGGRLQVGGYAPLKAWRWIRKSGGAPSPLGNDPTGHVLYLRHERPDVYARTAVFLEPVDYLNLRFTGRIAATPASMITSWLTDNRDLGSARYDPELVKMSTLDPRQLPPLQAVSSIVATVLPEVARDLGLPDGVQVVTGTPDLHSAAIGAGAIADYEPHLAISTTSWISCHVPFKRTDAMRQIATVPSVIPGRYLLANNHDTAGVCLQWLRDNVVVQEDGLLSATPSPDGYRAYDSLAATVPAGSDGVVFTPWLAGERCPVDDRNVRAAFYNLSLRTTRAHMVRAVLEGVAFNARWMLDAVEKFVRRPLGAIRFIGGGAASDVWCQIHADVLRRPVHRVAEPLLVNVRGAAIFAGLVLGEVQHDEVARLARIDATFEPRPANFAVYDDLYREYPGMYHRQRKMYTRLNGRPSASSHT